MARVSLSQTRVVRHHGWLYRWLLPSITRSDPSSSITVVEATNPDGYIAAGSTRGGPIRASSSRGGDCPRSSPDDWAGSSFASLPGVRETDDRSRTGTSTSRGQVLSKPCGPLRGSDCQTGGATWALVRQHRSHPVTFSIVRRPYRRCVRYADSCDEPHRGQACGQPQPKCPHDRLAALGAVHDTLPPSPAQWQPSGTGRRSATRSAWSIGLVLAVRRRPKCPVAYTVSCLGPALGRTDVDTRKPGTVAQHENALPTDLKLSSPRWVWLVSMIWPRWLEAYVRNRHQRGSAQDAHMSQVPAERVSFSVQLGMSSTARTLRRAFAGRASDLRESIDLLLVPMSDADGLERRWLIRGWGQRLGASAGSVAHCGDPLRRSARPACRGGPRFRCWASGAAVCVARPLATA